MLASGMILASTVASAYPPTPDRSASAGIWSTRERTASEIRHHRRQHSAAPSSCPMISGRRAVNRSSVRRMPSHCTSAPGNRTDCSSTPVTEPII
uniref:Putative secreted protein n=1 Tax=Anopheles darlingi TaxID=43151 RepID=A0A2M4DEM8_ANODA